MKIGRFKELDKSFVNDFFQDFAHSVYKGYGSIVVYSNLFFPDFGMGITVGFRH